MPVVNLTNKKKRRRTSFPTHSFRLLLNKIKQGPPWDAETKLLKVELATHGLRCMCVLYLCEVRLRLVLALLFCFYIFSHRSGT